MDVVLVGWALPPRSTVVAKKSLQYLPVAGLFAHMAFVLIDRSNKASSIATLAAAADRVRLRVSCGHTHSAAWSACPTKTDDQTKLLSLF
jgi:1-acyl-sn-glycerol-3-phosphate acyltransferase